MNLNKIYDAGIRVAGDTSFRDKRCPQEDAELVTLINQWKMHPDLSKVPVIHIPNEKKRRDKQDFAELKKQKLKGAFVPGASDIFAVGCPTLIIEMKRRDHTTSEIYPDQIQFLQASQNAGAWVTVALGWEAAFKFALNWYRINFP